MTLESAQYTQPDRDTNWVEHEAKLAGRPSNNKSLFIKGAKTVFSVGLGLAAAFGITKPVDALVKHALDLDNVKPRSGESSMTKEYFTQTADTQEILGAVNNFGMGELRQVLVIPQSPDNDLIPYFRDAIAKLEVPNVTDISTIVVEGASVRPANGTADKLLFSDQINMPDFGLFAVTSDVDGNKHIIGGISNGYLTGLKLVPDESVVALDLVIQDDEYGIVTSNGFLPIFDINSDNTLNANSIDASTEFVAYNGEAVAVGPVAVVTATAAPDLNSDTLNPISQEFLEFQSRVAAMGTEVNIGSDGVFYDKGGKPIDGISADPATGEIKIMVNGAPLVIESSRVHVSETGGITVDGYGFDVTTGNFIEKNAAQIWAERPIKEFSWCKDPTKFEDCVIPFSELQEQARFAQSKLTEDMFDKSKFATVSDYRIIDGHLIPSPFDKPPHFTAAGSAPFLKDFMFGKTNINGVEHYVIQVPYFVEGVPANEWPVMTGICPVGPGGYKEYNMEVFRDKMNLVPWDVVDIDIATKFINPETGKNFTKAEVQTIIEQMKEDNFANTHGMVFQFKIADNDSGWYE